MQSTPVPDAAAEVELIKSIVSRYFSIYETKLSYEAVSFKCQVNKELLEQNFKSLRDELAKRDYIAIISYKGGEHTITVGKLPKVKPRGVWINFVFLAMTLVSTIIAGIILWKGYAGENSGPFFTLDSILMGALTFAIPLLLILGVHEMGHYFTARKYGVPSSLPFFIPAPPPIGTFGAFISIRAPIPDRKTLFDLGVAGPICGFIASIPIAIIGLILTSQGAKIMPAETGGSLYITLPMIYDFIGFFIPIPGDYILHPTAMAGWVGFLVTAINLLPAGSLDGGHVARAVFGQNARYISWVAVFALFIIGVFFSTGWLLFAILVLLIGMEHAPPLNDITPLKIGRKFVGICMAVILVTSFVLVPMGIVEPDYSFKADLRGDSSANISLTMDHTFDLRLTSTGNLNTELVFDVQPKGYVGFTLEYHDNASGANVSAPANELMLPVGNQLTAFVTIFQDSPVYQPGILNGTILITAKNDSNFKRSLHINITEIAGNYTHHLLPSSSTIAPDEQKNFFLTISNRYPSDLIVKVTAIVPAEWSAWIYLDTLANATNQLEITITPETDMVCTITVEAPAIASSGESVEISLEIMADSLDRIETETLTLTVT